MSLYKFFTRNRIIDDNNDNQTILNISLANSNSMKNVIFEPTALVRRLKEIRKLLFRFLFILDS